ncbi:Chaperone protein ClpB [Pelomyxa schiedti]|nr:Chaperone protein ClpB [Pelomyxa schiedti]
MDVSFLPALWDMACHDKATLLNFVRQQLPDDNEATTSPPEIPPTITPPTPAAPQYPTSLGGSVVSNSAFSGVRSPMRSFNQQTARVATPTKSSSPTVACSTFTEPPPKSLEQQIDELGEHILKNHVTGELGDFDSRLDKVLIGPKVTASTTQTVKINTLGNSHMSLLGFAVIRSDEILIERLVKRGAKVDSNVLNFPLIFLPIKFAGNTQIQEYTFSCMCLTAKQREKIVVRSRINAPLMLRLLLRLGASPEVVDEENVPVMHRVKDSFQMCYWVQRSLDKQIHSPKMTKYYVEARAPELGSIFFSLVGQQIAVDFLEKKIMYKLVTNPRWIRKPLVAFLAGPPGAGKSQLAEDVAKAVSPGHWFKDVFSSVDGGMVHSHLFGAERGYIGSDSAPPLAKFIREHNGQRAVVVLEEFEKLDTEALRALLVPFETGEWPVHSTGGRSGEEGSHMDVSKFVFLLTSNLRNSDIIDWCARSDVLRLYNDAIELEERQRMMKKVASSVFDIISEHYKRTSVKEFTRRIDIVVPFLTLSDTEKVVLVEHLQTLRAARFLEEPRGDQLWGDVEINYTPQFTQWVINKYDQLDGASSFLRVLDDSMSDVFDQIRSSQVPPPQVWLHTVDGVQCCYKHPPPPDDPPPSECTTQSSSPHDTDNTNS